LAVVAGDDEPESINDAFRFSFKMNPNSFSINGSLAVSGLLDQNRNRLNHQGVRE